MIKQLKRVLLIALLYVSGPLFLIFTTPKTLPLPLLILPFIWLFAVIVASCLLLYQLLLKRQITKRAQLNAGLLALIPVLLAILQSIHQLAVKDVVLVVGVVLVASFYVTKLDLGA